MDISQITRNLYIGTTPGREDFDLLRSLGVTLVINMRLERRPLRDHHNPAIRTLWLPSLDSPLFPIPIRTLKRGARAALDEFALGGAVLVHCAAGVHRSVAQAAAILIAQGESLDAAIERIKAAREVADPDVGYIHRRIVRFATEWAAEGGSQIGRAGEAGPQSPPGSDG